MSNNNPNTHANPKLPPNERYAESIHNLALLDPPQWGWTAAGGMTDLLPPHERARRSSTKQTFLRELHHNRRKRDASEAFGDAQQPAQKKQPQSAAPATNDNVVAPNPSLPSVATNNNFPPNNEEATPKQPLPNNNHPISFSALNLHNNLQNQNDNNTLDLYTYHRGRQGLELRDLDTGDWRCDVPPTDTRHHLAERDNMVANVTIQFAIGNTNNSNHTTLDAASDNNNKSYYRETIPWDVQNAETPPPAVFCAHLAEQYGLTLSQTLELTESIQTQLYHFLSDRAAYTPAWPIVQDAFGTRREVVPSQNSVLYALYGEIMGPVVPGGMMIPKRQAKAAAAARLTRQPSYISQASHRQGASLSRASSMSRSQAGNNNKNNNNKNKAKVELEYREEVCRRLLEESTSRILDKLQEQQHQQQQNSQKQPQDKQLHEQSEQKQQETLQQPKAAAAAAAPSLHIALDSRCHLCRRDKDKVAVFACGNVLHGLCSHHLMEHYGLSLDEAALDFCPICSLACDCKPCSKRLDRVAMSLKQQRQQQDTSLAETTFEDLFEHATALENAFEAGAKAKMDKMENNSKKCKYGMLRTVDKVPLSEFPSEFARGQAMDPGTAVDYRTVYTADGPYVLPECESVETTSATASVPEVPQPEDKATAESSTEPDIGNSEAASLASARTARAALTEDGSVDHCMLCKQCGNLLCCDKCPRAYHARCIDVGDTDLTADKWECPSCKREADGIPGEIMEPGKSLAAIIAAFDGKVDKSSPKVLRELKVLSLIYEMLQYLMQYDFGFIFSSPVDVEQVPLYPTIVKEPMDLGTIAEKLMNGGYKQYIAEKSLEFVIIAAFNDIELVWHNCFIFNAPGSAIYQMAEVQRAAAKRIWSKSFDEKKLLSHKVRKEIQDYRKSSEIYRRQLSQLANVAAKRDGLANNKKRHKITAGLTNAAGKAVAVLDPDTGRLVKMYSTVTAAIAAIDLFMTLKYPCEWEFSKGAHHAQVIRRIIKESSKDTDHRLFGYRWLQLEDLKAGKVRFLANSEAKENAVMSSKSSKAGGDNGKNEQRKDARFEPCPSSPRSNKADGHVFTVVKTNLASGETLEGFDTVDTAYEDWLSTLDACQNTTKELKTPDTFKEHYLNGSRNIDGVAWRATSAKKMDFPDSSNVLEEDKSDFEPIDQVEIQVQHPSVWSSLGSAWSAVKNRSLSGKEAKGALPPDVNGLVSPLVPKNKNGTNLPAIK